MEDGPEDLPKPPRSTAARPFFSPRPEGVTGPLELGRRRAAQLFTPPASAPATPAAEKSAPMPMADQAPISEREVEEPADLGASTAHVVDDDAPMIIESEDSWSIDSPLTEEHAVEHDSPADTLHAHRNSFDDDNPLVVEMEEHEEIELTAAASSSPDEHRIEVIGYDDANSLLKAAASEGEIPKVDGMMIESTEFSFQQRATPTLNIESFWATEPFAAPEPVSEEALAEVGAADVPTLEGVEFNAIDGAANLASVDDTEMLDTQPFSWTDDLVESDDQMQADGVVDDAPVEPSVIEDAPMQGAPVEPVVASEPAAPAAPIDIAPPWLSRATPMSTPALEELKEAEPWMSTPAFGQATISDEPLAIEHLVIDEPVAQVPSHRVADALERIAAQVRDGKLELPSSAELSDEAALAAALTALLRLPR